MKKDFAIPTLGKASVRSPLGLSTVRGDNIFNFISDEERILYDLSLDSFNRCIKNNEPPLSLEKAGPRKTIFFNPKKTKAAIVTCGGLCPGINNVMRSIVMALYYFYGIKDIVGIPYGYEGLNSKKGRSFIKLTPDKVKDIHEFGGTILGSSRGAQSTEDMVDSLVDNDINILFTIGGDGTLKGTDAIGEEIA